MKKRMLGLVCLLFLVGSVGYVQAESRTVGSFNAITVCCGIDVYLSEGNSSVITVETNYEEYLPQIKTEVKKGKLKVSFNMRNQIKRPKDMWIKVNASATNLSEITSTSGAEVRSKEPLKAGSIEISANSGGGVKIELHATQLKCSVSSGADVRLTGSATTAAVSASSGGNINMKEMQVKVAEASASTGSDISLFVTEEVKAKASVGANIKYKGNPKTVNKKTSIGGDVRQVD